MKKLLLILLLALSTVTFSLDAHLRLGITTDSNRYQDEDRFTNYSPTAGLEVTQSLLFLNVGAGAQYYHKVNGSDVSTLPVYALAKWNIFPIAIKPYLVTKAGTTVYTKDDRTGSDAEGKGFFGVGVGADVSNLQVEALYTETKLDDSKRRRDGDRIKQVSLTVGYKIW